MSYEPINWQNGVTPLNDENLNKMDSAIAELDAKTTELSEQVENFATKDEIPKIDIATTEKAGIVKPDGTTTYIDADGTLHAAGGGGGGTGTGGTSDYNALLNKPSINGVSLQGNKTLADLGIDDLADEKVSDLHEDTLGGFIPVIDATTGQITGYKTKAGADTVFPFKRGDIERVTGTFTTSTSSAVKVTLGFKPKILFIVGSSHESMYSEDINRAIRITVSGKTAEVVTLTNSSNNRLNSINSDGFTYGKSNVGVETMTYYAYK